MMVFGYLEIGDHIQKGQICSGTANGLEIQLLPETAMENNGNIPGSIFGSRHSGHLTFFETDPHGTGFPVKVAETVCIRLTQIQFAVTAEKSFVHIPVGNGVVIQRHLHIPVIDHGRDYKRAVFYDSTPMVLFNVMSHFAVHMDGVAQRGFGPAEGRIMDAIGNADMQILLGSGDLDNGFCLGGVFGGNPDGDLTVGGGDGVKTGDQEIQLQVIVLNGDYMPGNFRQCHSRVFGTAPPGFLHGSSVTVFAEITVAEAAGNELVEIEGIPQGVFSHRVSSIVCVMMGVKEIQHDPIGN